jgi:quinolinate synthetase A protein
MSTTASIDARIKAAPAAELCSEELQWDPWAYDTAPDRRRLPLYGAGASQWDEIPPSAPVQIEIPERYRAMTDDAVARSISAAKTALGPRLVILGHHYQRDEIIRWADFRGDSFKLSQQAASRREADFIVFSRTWPRGARWPTWPTRRRSSPAGGSSVRCSGSAPRRARGRRSFPSRT